jgi:hypothetical protein
LISGGSIWSIPTPIASLLDSNGGELGDNVFYLGKQGLYATTSGIRIVYLSGMCPSGPPIQPPQPSQDASFKNPEPTADDSSIPYSVHYSSHQVQTLIASLAAHHPGADAKSVDILITAEGPEGVTNGSSLWNQHHANSKIPTSGLVSDLAFACQPRYHFSSGNLFFEREPYLNPKADHVTRFISLGEFGSANKERVRKESAYNSGFMP